MPSNHLILYSPLLLLSSIFPSIRIFSFPVSQLFASGGQIIGASASASVFPMNIWSRFSLELTEMISVQSKGLSRVFSSATVQKHQFFGIHRLLYGPTLTSTHDYWKNHSFDSVDLCLQTDISAFRYAAWVCHRDRSHKESQEENSFSPSLS